MENKKEGYEVTDKMIEEAIVQEIYLQVGFKTAVCVLILNTGSEVIGSYSPVDSDEVDIVEGKDAARKVALSLARTQLEAVANWRKTIDSIQKARAKAVEDQAAAAAKEEEEKKPATRQKVRPIKKADKK